MFLHDTSDEGLFRISTLWENREALEQMRRNTGVPFAVEIFKTHGAEPNTRILRSTVLHTSIIFPGNHLINQGFVIHGAWRAPSEGYLKNNEYDLSIAIF